MSSFLSSLPSYLMPGAFPQAPKKSEAVEAPVLSAAKAQQKPSVKLAAKAASNLAHTVELERMAAGHERPYHIDGVDYVEDKKALENLIAFKTLEPMAREATQANERLRDLDVLNSMPDAVAYNLSKTAKYKNVDLALNPTELNAVNNAAMKAFANDGNIFPMGRLARAKQAMLGALRGFAACVASMFGSVVGAVRRSFIKLNNWIRGIKPSEQMDPTFEQSWKATKTPSRDEKKKALESKAAEAQAKAEQELKNAAALHEAEIANARQARIDARTAAKSKAAAAKLGK
jgi:hypothetical protein